MATNEASATGGEANQATRAASPGLRDLVVLESEISAIEGDVLSYRGITIDELAEHATFEEVVYLLWNGKLPGRAELIELKEQLATAGQLSPGLIELMRSFPRRAAPMEVVQTAVSAMALYDPEAEDMSPAANRRKAVRLLGQIASVVAAYDRIRNGRAVTPPRPDLSLAANFLYMLRGLMPDPLAVRALDKAYVLHAEHELNASTFAARVAASAMSDLHSAILAAISTLKGTLHGGANERVMRMLNEIGQVGQVEPYIRQRLAEHEKIYGFGHPVYKTADPRARHLKELARELGKMTGQEHWFEMSEQIEERMRAAKGLPPNIDFYSASVYHYLSIAADLFTPIFVISRTAGWVAHVLEQYERNKLMRPRAHYSGPRGLHWTPLEKRTPAAGGVGQAGSSAAGSTGN